MVAEAALFVPVAAASSLDVYFCFWEGEWSRENELLSRFRFLRPSQGKEHLLRPESKKYEIHTVPQESTNTEPSSFLFLTRWSSTASAAGLRQILPRQTMSTRVWAEEVEVGFLSLGVVSLVDEDDRRISPNGLGALAAFDAN